MADAQKPSEGQAKKPAVRGPDTASGAKGAFDAASGDPQAEPREKKEPDAVKKAAEESVGKGAGEAAKELGKGAAGKGLSTAADAAAAAQGAAAGAFSAVKAGVVGAVKGAVSAVAGAVASAASAVAAAGGAAVSAVGAGAAAVVAAGAIVATAITGAQEAQRDGDAVNLCSEVESSISKSDAAVGDISALQEEYIKKTWSVVAAAGGTFKQAAGILGCWMVESGIDPTSVETVFDEKYQYGETKQAYEKKDFVCGDCVPSYKSRFPRIIKLGLGLGQWTDTTDGATRNTDLRAYADSIKKPWYDMDTQLGFMIGPDSGAPTFREYIAEHQDDSVDACTEWFLARWEGVPGNKLAERQSAAGTIAVKLKSMEPDKAYGQSIIAVAGAASGSATSKSKGSALDDCEGGTTGNYDNSSLAAAMVSLSYKTQAEGNGNDGTELYQKVHKAVLPGDGYFQSCDRGVATAVRWSGSDDDFPAGPTATQYEYLKNSEKWKEVTEFNGGDWTKLQPGDVVITKGDGHVCMYVGNAAIKARYPDAPDSYDICSASYGERSPGCGVGQYEFGGRAITAFRCVKPDNSPKYKDADK